MPNAASTGPCITGATGPPSLCPTPSSCGHGACTPSGPRWTLMVVPPSRLTLALRLPLGLYWPSAWALDTESAVSSECSITNYQGGEIVKPALRSMLTPLILILAILLSLLACGDGSDGSKSSGKCDCELSCSTSGSKLMVKNSCCGFSSSCSYSYDSFGRVSKMTCSCASDSFSCNISYNGMGWPTGSCSNGCDSCSF